MAAHPADDVEGTVSVLMRRYGRTYAEDAGIIVRDQPAPLFRLLVLSLLLSTRIRSDIAVAAARELFRAGYRTPRAMHDASWRARVDALGRAHYRRYDESGRDVQQFKGIGPAGAAIFCREVQGVWPGLAPYVDGLAADGAERLGLPRNPERLAGLVADGDLPRLVAACVRAARHDEVVDDVRRG